MFGAPRGSIASGVNGKSDAKDNEGIQTEKTGFTGYSIGGNTGMAKASGGSLSTNFKTKNLLKMQI